MSAFPERLKSLRNDRKIMAKSMAELLKITPRNYQSYERGRLTRLLLKQFFWLIFFKSRLIICSAYPTIPLVLDLYCPTIFQPSYRVISRF